MFKLKKKKKKKELENVRIYLSDYQIMLVRNILKDYMKLRADYMTSTIANKEIQNIIDRLYLDIMATNYARREGEYKEYL